jgi:hypothetical protein
VKLSADEKMAERTRAMPSGCIEYQGYIDPAGYGRIGVNGVMEYTHRYVYKRDVGEIPKGYFVMHSCDNPPCCNPAHLRVGTALENVQDRHAKGRSAKGSQMGTSKVNETDVLVIRALSEAGLSQSKIGKRYGMTQSSISRIVNRLAFKDVA